MTKVWKFYQYNNHPIVYGWNNLWANNIYQGKTYQGKSMNPAALGMSTADARRDVVPRSGRPKEVGRGRGTSHGAKNDAVQQRCHGEGTSCPRLGLCGMCVESVMFGWWRICMIWWVVKSVPNTIQISPAGDPNSKIQTGTKRKIWKQLLFSTHRPSLPWTPSSHDRDTITK